MKQSETISPEASNIPHAEVERHSDVPREHDREELLRQLRAFRGRLPADFRFDRDEANSR
jgi:antitoxin MazE